MSRLSDIANLPVEDRTFCVEAEFASRNDGFVPMLETYGIPLGDPQGVPRENIVTLDTGAVYEAIDQGACNFGEVFTTDGRIKSLNLAVLEDDKNFFPKYNVSVVVRQQTLEQAPQLRQLLEPVTDALTDDVLIELNARVDVDGEEPVDVAWSWLQEAGFLTAG